MNADATRFEAARWRVIGTEKKRLSIGTMSEKSLHAILKYYCEPDEDQHEIPIDRFVADIYRDGTITEIQTRQFGRMREKLAIFLDQYQVTVVYPIAMQTWVSWIDDQTGEIKQRRRSSHKGNLYSIFPELYQIKQFLAHPNFRLRILQMNVDEYRILDGYGKNKKIRATKFDRVPQSLVDELLIERPEDYLQFLPYELDGVFTTKEFAKSAKISPELARYTLHILVEVGLVRRAGKKSNAFLYECALEV
jgi:Mn-dependent DtxR family transcriptional regulator